MMELQPRDIKPYRAPYFPMVQTRRRDGLYEVLTLVRREINGVWYVTLCRQFSDLDRAEKEPGRKEEMMQRLMYDAYREMVLSTITPDMTGMDGILLLKLDSLQISEEDRLIAQQEMYFNITNGLKRAQQSV